MSKNWRAYIPDTKSDSLTRLQKQGRALRHPQPTDVKQYATIVEFDLTKAELDYQKLLEELHNYGKPAGSHDDVADTGEEFDNVSD